MMCQKTLAAPEQLHHALRQFLWMAICWNDHNFDEGTIAKECREICDGLGITSTEDANDLLGNFIIVELEQNEHDK